MSVTQAEKKAFIMMDADRIKKKRNNLHKGMVVTYPFFLQKCHGLKQGLVKRELPSCLCRTCWRITCQAPLGNRALQPRVAMLLSVQFPG